MRATCEYRVAKPVAVYKRDSAWALDTHFGVTTFRIKFSLSSLSLLSLSRSLAPSLPLSHSLAPSLCLALSLSLPSRWYFYIKGYCNGYSSSFWIRLQLPLFEDSTCSQQDFITT